MKRWIDDIDKNWKTYALAGCVCVLFFVALTNLDKIWSVIAGFFSVIEPLVLGFVIAYIVNPAAVFLDERLLGKMKNRRMSWIFSVVLVFLLVIAFLGMLLIQLIPQAFSSLDSLVKNYPVYIEELKIFLSENEDLFSGFFTMEDLMMLISSDGSILKRLGELIFDNASAIMKNGAEVGGGGLKWLIGTIFSLYYLLAKKQMKKFFSHLLFLTFSSVNRERVMIVLEKFHSIFSKYIVYELLDGLIVGTINYVFMLVTRMPDALAISFVAGFTNLVPTFGPVIGAAVGAFLLLLMKPGAIASFLIFTLLLQLLDAYIIKPKLFGTVLDVPGVVILMNVLVFGKLLGMTGMLLAIPLAGIESFFYVEVITPWVLLRREVRQYKKGK